jgi:hypothetical protein
MSTDHQSEISNPMFFGLLAGGVAGYGAYQADLADVPILTPCLDWCTGHLFALVPTLQTLPANAWFITSGAEAGLMVLVIVAVLFARLEGPSSSSKPLEMKLKKRVRRQKWDHWAGFNS